MTKALTAEDILLARKLWSLGHNTAEIAKILRVSEAIVYNGRHYFRSGVDEETPAERRA